ncbi:hypothetical protein IGI04_007167 [Brassica rapa subsp. trilocularis]|uniref:CASP-like protein n=1 Tax=Brassica rapa subsp. trilocularis TaxID=1813537 RepID=A0ABQ7NJB1_BRACM|nr:hypothetical protein IGI04_007167 [Brassica rapa subsp. trilocularis]
MTMDRIFMYSLCSVFASVFDAVKMLSLATACATVSFLFDSFDEDSSRNSSLVNDVLSISHGKAWWRCCFAGLRFADILWGKNLLSE